jgi:hypothetical protein
LERACADMQRDAGYSNAACFSLSSKLHQKNAARRSAPPRRGF